VKVFILDKNDSLGKLITILGKRKFPMLSRAVKLAANSFQSTWVKEVEKSSSKEGWKNAYADAIKIENRQDPFSSAVSAKGKFVTFVEKGVKRFDMRPGIALGPKARISKDGTPYNIVFIRKKTPTAKGSKKGKLSQQEYSLSKTLKRYKVKGIGSKIPFDTRKEKKYTRPDQKKGIVKVGGSGHSAYGSFRIVTRNSPGWMYPGVPASPVFKKAIEKASPEIKNLLQKGLMADLESGFDYMAGKTK
jgi:hypothetical protein